MCLPTTRISDTVLEGRATYSWDTEGARELPRGVGRQRQDEDTWGAGKAHL